MIEGFRRHIAERLSESSVPVRLIPKAAFRIAVYALTEYPRHPLTPARLVWGTNRNFVAVVKGEK